MNTITPANIGIFLLENIPGFKQYYYDKGYSNDDLSDGYTVITLLHRYIKKTYLNENYYLLPGKENDFIEIMRTLKDLLSSEYKEITDLIIIGFLEGISQQVENKIQMDNLRNALYFQELQKGLDTVNEFWGN